ncbi:MAG: MltA domain-containing protein [Cyanobacteria bacterium J06628_6]
MGYDADFGEDRQALLQAIDHSLSYLNSEKAAEDYAEVEVPAFSRDRVRRSLVRFRQLVAQSHSAAELQTAVAAEFAFYRSVGNDGEGTVAFTGYFEPTYAASRVRTDEYRYPLYAEPADLDSWAEPHPTRAELEGTDGLQGVDGPLQGLELVWLRDRLEAFLVQVQGSARLQMTDGSIVSVGYAGRTNYDYTSIGRALIDDGIVAEADLSLPVLLDYFQENPIALDEYLPRNDRFVFFKVTDGGPPTGNLSVPVTAGRSIATDKSIMPPGALAIIALEMPERDVTGEWGTVPMSRYVLDQDTGGAIRGAGRVDIFVGTGTAAGEQAGLINTTGELYYLLLRE